MKQFKLVFRNEINTYELWFTDYKGEWCLSAIYYTFDTDGNVIESEYNDPAMINENILWEMNKMTDLGYKFSGIERS